MLRDGRSFGFEPQGEHSFDKASQWLSVNKQKLLEVCYYSHISRAISRSLSNA